MAEASKAQGAKLEPAATLRLSLSVIWWVFFAELLMSTYMTTKVENGTCWQVGFPPIASMTWCKGNSQ